MANKTLRSAFRFFLLHAGYSTPPGKAACALHLAKAEQWADAQGLEYIWEDDPDTDLGDHEYWCPTAKLRHQGNISRETYRAIHANCLSVECSHEGYSCRLVKPCPRHGADCRHAEVLASLGGIIDPSNEYRRVVEAELAMEAM